nr:hypothetical protein CFP56_05040 [Quercus suber]
MVLDPEGSPTEEGDTPIDIVGALAYIRAFMVDGESLPATDRGRYLATKAKLEELTKDNKVLLRKISDVINKVPESEKLYSKAEENIRAITERKEALEKELQEVKKTLEDKTMKLGAFVAADNEKIQATYY